MSKQSQKSPAEQNPPEQRSSGLQVVPKNASVSGVTHERISKRAYELFVQRGYQNGHHEEDWKRAESELKGTR